MISLKKHLDERAAVPADLLKTITSAYQSALLAIGRAAARTTPNLAPDFAQELASIEPKANPSKIAEIDRKVVSAIENWGDRSSDYLRQKTSEVKEILLLVTRSAQSAGDKDDRYVSQLSEFAGRLDAIANLDDLTSIRQSLTRSAVDLKACVTHMAEDGKELVSKLRIEVAAYQTRLQEAEKQASIDPLTGLDNRRGIERKIEDRMVLRRPFSVILFDLNGFKKINDIHGHLAGDELLKQFASELRSRFRSGDAAGRWGGDEFLVVSDGTEEQAQAALGKAAEWLFGEYRLKSEKVTVSAAAGVAQWNGIEDIAALLKRADASMYSQKTPRVA